MVDVTEKIQSPIKWNLKIAFLQEEMITQLELS